MQRMRRATRTTGVLLAISAISALVACSAAHEGAPPSDDERGPGDTEPCDGPSLGPASVAEAELRGPSEAPVGGDLSPGVYDLVEVLAFAGAPPPATCEGTDDPPPYEEQLSPPRDPCARMRMTGAVTRATVEVHPGTIHRVEERADGSLAREVARVQTSGSEISFTPRCPRGTASRIGYSAAGASLTLFIDTAHQHVFVRRR